MQIFLTYSAKNNIHLAYRNNHKLLMSQYRHFQFLMFRGLEMNSTLAMMLLLVNFSVSAAEESANPLLGTWEWVNIKNSCVEHYIFGIENTAYVTSGEEQSTASYTISTKPTGKGFYEVTLNIIEDKGGMDCGDRVDNNSGDSYKKFVMFHPGGNHYVSCDSEDIKDCVGPFKRIQ